MSSNCMQQQQLQQPPGPPGLNPMSTGFVPRGPTGPLPVDTFGCSTRLVQEGGEMRATPLSPVGVTRLVALMGTILNRVRLEVPIHR